MLKRETEELYRLAHKWLDEANDIMADRRAGNYADPVGNVRAYQRAVELRRCARNLKRRVDGMYRRTH